ncbi:unnamed protein product [Rodentolepis nana]|uniref:PH domain-containing protein n=1 Tax=Rodentolepis nana TaxID=102285 RepID=A0A0R3T0C7_RODNA|nr:unnamed protein product [Rodentolepis nana]
MPDPADTSKPEGSKLDSSSNCSASLLVEKVPLSHSIHDLRSTEGELTSEDRRALLRSRKNHQLDDLSTGRSYSERSPNARSLSRNHLTVPTASTISSRSHTHSNSSQESTEYPDATSRKPPEPLKDFITKNRKRPMKGWHELTRGRNITRIDLANTNVKCEADKLRIIIDTSAFVYQLKFEDPDKFQKWLTAIKEHRAYDQFQSALVSTGRPSGFKPTSSTSSNVGGDGVMSTSSCASFPTTPECPDRSKTLRQQQRLANEQMEAIGKQVLRLESIYADLQNAESLLLDATEIDNFSPTRSLFLSPLPYNPSDVASNKPNHSRVSSISSMTSLYTAVQVTPTIVADPHPNHMNGISNKKETGVVSNAANFINQAKRFIEEARATLALVQQTHQGLNSAITTNKNSMHTLTTNPKPGRSSNIRLETDLELEMSGVENSEDSNSDDMPVLNESDMNVLDMKGVALRTPEHVAGRRTTLPAQQTVPTTISLLAIIKNNIGREMSKPRLPAIVNEPLSVLQNLCEEMEYSNLLDLASEMKDQTQRMLYVATFIITTFTSKAQRKAIKPFSPLLGETFECIRPEKKWRFLAEQVVYCQLMPNLDI